MKRISLIFAGAVSLLFAGCCCDWGNCCNPCGNTCNTGCGPAYAAPPPGASYSPYGAPVISAVPMTYAPATAAVTPLESLPTY